jgi:hypothetical protein
MHQILLQYKYEKDRETTKLTGLAGLPFYLDFTRGLGFDQALRRHLNQEVSACCVWKPSDMVASLLLLNLSGGDNVEDLHKLQDDAGLSKLLGKFAECGLRGSERRTFRLLKNRQHAGNVASASTVFRFLKQDGTTGLEPRKQGSAYIPAAGRTVQQLCACNKDLLSSLWANRKCGPVTLDIDATVIETHKEDALYSYKGYAAYQPVNVWWAEQRVMVYTEFRDGNVPAGYALQSVLKRALGCLPKKGKPVYLCSDAAGYTHELMKFCEDAEDRIQFAIGCPVSQEFRKAVLSLPDTAWHRLDKKRQYAEVCFVPNALAKTKKRKYEFRYIATRECLPEQGTLVSMPPVEYPFPVIELEGNKYKIHGLVTNRELPAPELVQWYYDRCGNSEEAHAILKNDLAGGVFPSNHFHANAVWWWIAVLAHNIHSLFKLLCCDKSWLQSRLKRMRFAVINIPGRVLERGRQLYIRLNGGDSAYELLESIRQAIGRLRPCMG